MRAALCLYGQPREFSGNWNYILKNVVEPNNADVFFHSWFDPEDTSIKKMTPGHEYRHLDDNLHYELETTIHPESYQIEKPRKFSENDFGLTTEQKKKNLEIVWPWAGGYDLDTFIKDRIRCHYSMWYSIMQSILLKELYAQKHGFKYDCVILSRFDVSPKVPLDVSKYDLETLITPDLGHPRGEVCDWFMFSNNINMNIVGGLFNFVDYYMKKIIDQNGVWTNEAFLRDHLEKFGVWTNRVSEIKITF